MKLRDGALPYLCHHHNTEPTWVARCWSTSGVGQEGITEEWAIQWSFPFASQILFVTLMCCFCSIPLTHISVEEHVSFSELFHSANLLSKCACVSVSEWDVTVRVGRGCDKSWWQSMQSWIPVFHALWLLSGEEETEGTDVSFPTVRKLLIKGKGRKVLESV